MTVAAAGVGTARTLRSRIDGRWWLLAVGLLWIGRYGASFGLHPLSPPRWDDWFDQGNYVRSAVAFAGGDLAARMHWYPLAYPLLAAPFVAVVRGDPFLVPDMALYLIACAGFAQAMESLGLARRVAIPVFLLTSLVVDSTAALWLVPWNTTLSAALTWWLIAAGAAAFRDGNGPPPSRRNMIVLGGIAGALPLVRPTESLTSACGLAVIAVVLLRQRRLRWRGIGAIAIGGVAVVAPYALLYLAIYGPMPSTYMVEAAKQGFAFADLPWKAYVLIVTAQPWYPDAPSLIERLPWLLPGAAGLLLAIVTLRGHGRRVMILIAAIAVPHAALFLAYTDLQPPGLWTFNNAHYFKWLFPLAGAGVAIWLQALRDARRRAPALAALLAVTAPACLRILPVAVGEERPARLLMFRGSTRRSWTEAYQVPVRIVDDAGTGMNVGLFHQLPDANGERAVAIRRPFAGHPRRTDPGEAPPFATAEAPYARYGERLSVGLPCWIARSTCRLP